MENIYKQIPVVQSEAGFRLVPNDGQPWLTLADESGNNLASVLRMVKREGKWSIHLVSGANADLFNKAPDGTVALVYG